MLSTLAWTAADRLDPGPSGKLPPGAINARRWTARCPLCGYAELYTQDGLGRLFKDQDDDHERRRAGLTRAAWADRARGLDDTDGG